jgi:hypothetical protein
MRAASAVFGFFIFVLFLGSHAQADEQRITIGKLGNNPPFEISGWRYQLINKNVHMNFCGGSACEPGSKVSYIVLGPKKNYSFKQYKAEREKIAQALRKLSPAGMRIEFAEPQLLEDRLFRIYKTTRKEVAPDGKTAAYISQLVIANKVSIDFISSASDLKKAEEQLEPFLLAGMMVATLGEVTVPGGAHNRRNAL